MKKLVAIALISISIFSCKKETKQVTRVNPETGKTETVEVEVTPEEAKKPMAISDSAGVYKMKFILEKGKTYPFNTKQIQEQSMTDPTGKKMSIKQETSDDMNFTVNNLDKGVYDISIKILGKKTVSSGNGQSVTIDTNQAEPKDPGAKLMWKVNKAMAGQVLNMKMKESGEVVSITGFEPLYAKANAAVVGILKDAKEKKGFAEQLEATFNEGVIKDQLTKSMNIIPEKGVKIGESWTKTEKLDPQGKLVLSTTYTLNKVENGVAEVSVKGGIPLKSEKQTQQGLTQSISFEGSQTGNLRFDAYSGWLTNSTISMKSTSKQSITDGKKSQSITQNTNTTISVN